VVTPIDHLVVPFDPEEYGAVGIITMTFSLQKVIHSDPENYGVLSVQM
jgi:hypothetical protein